MKTNKQWLEERQAAVLDGEPAPDTIIIGGYVGELSPEVDADNQWTFCGQYVRVSWDIPEELRTEHAVLIVMNGEGVTCYQERVCNHFESLANPARGFYSFWCTLPPGHYYVRLVAVK